MKSPTSLVRLKTFHLREKQRHLQQLETMEREFQRMVAALNSQIQEEERKSGIVDNTHFAYSIFAKAAANRRDNLLHSINNLQERKEAARLLLQRANGDLEKARELEKREGQMITPPEEIQFIRRRAMIG
ncbi:MAG: flagellar export protein FliJ [Candidatus Tokpelaia sp.]|uniref:flagellar export protein FliJ n=1 Tax=Candidatus Tokpelaia sp. TaxID=2233777 RepID=UPI001239BABE|nr:flagellar export protein FliJ [Candidatus Tokpelaia sp.]KAA6205072.1 MAG: flagellar export protein FliJ [Candidatus Tokpelaia sp.]KAA6206526.1 MAG: flagellar export protein FliJ [Candidatus Tokpelaia sp.]KAA6405823.1 flagellar export protein FliJ [Candidatus Tokpelaia sp.]